AARDLEGEPAGRRHGRDIALRCDGVAIDRAGGPHRHVLGFGDVEVVVGRVQVGAPVEPHLACVLGQQVLFLEAVLQRELLRALADEQDVVGVFEHELRHLRRRLDPFQGAHGAGAPGRPVHTRRVELYDAGGVRQAAVAYRIIVGVELLDLHPLDHGVERVRSLHQQVERLLHRAQAIGARHRHRFRGPAAPGRQRTRRSHGKGDIERAGGGHTGRGGGEEVTARERLGHENTPVEVRVRRLRGRAGPVNLLLVDFADPPSMRAVIRGMLGAAAVVVGLALVVVSIAEGHVEWRLVALLLSLWGAWSFFGTLFESVVEPLGRFLGSALTGGAMPGDRAITIDELKALKRDHPELHIVALAANAGQTAAFAAGFRVARGRVVVTLDADLQNDPADIPALVAELAKSGATAVAGYRVERRDSGWKRLQSRIANGIRNRVREELP